MMGQYEDFRIYETLAQPGVPYPEEPSGTTAEIEQAIFDAPTVWYVRELVNPEYDESEEDPEITFIDSGKRFLMFAMGNGPVLGNDAGSPGIKVGGMTTAYLQEGTRLMGFWYNGQLYGVPLTVDDGTTYRIPGG